MQRERESLPDLLQHSCSLHEMALTEALEPQQLLESVKLEWPTPKTLVLIRGWEGSVTFQL